MADEEAIWDDDSGHVVRIKRRMVVDECDDDDELTRMDAWHFSGGEPAVPLFPKPTLTRSPSEYVRTQAAEEESTTEEEDDDEQDDKTIDDSESHIELGESEHPEEVDEALASLVHPATDLEPKRGSRRFFCTLNNWDESEYQQIRGWLEEKSEYAVIGKEIGPECGTPHLHIYMRLKNAITFKNLAKKPGFARCNIARCKGTEAENDKYVKKDGDYLVIHPENFQSQGQRRDLEEASQLLLTKGRAGLDELVRSDPKLFVQHHNGFRALLDFQDHKRFLSQNPTCVWFYGRSGSGKSHQCFEAVMKESSDRSVDFADISCAGLKWCDGYKGEKICIFNDLREVNSNGVKIPMNFWTSVIDKWPCRVEVKGSSLNMQADSFYITSVLHPSQFYAGDAREPNEQFLRRITKVIKCVKNAVDGVEIFTQIDMGNGLTPQPQSDIGFNIP